MLSLFYFPFIGILDLVSLKDAAHHRLQSALYSSQFCLNFLSSFKGWLKEVLGHYFRLQLNT